MAAEGQVISCHSLDQWKEQIEKEKDFKKLFFAKERSVEAMPTFIFLKEGNIMDRVVGAKKEDLHQTIVKHSTDMALTTASA